MESEKKFRAGRMVQQVEGYACYVPRALPPNPAIVYNDTLVRLLSQAMLSLGRLDGVAKTLPNVDLFLDMYVKKESLLSSQIEGTQASFVDILTQDGVILNEDQQEVSNYVAALRYGVERLAALPLSLRLIREIHHKLLETGRGSSRSPGEFRTTQNWIGPQGSNLHNAAYIPPAVHEMQIALADLERFIHCEEELPTLVKIALIHAQFETIHPFLDGNGRVGRLLITFLLLHHQILKKPLLYLSVFFKRHRAEYYDRLMDVRQKGAWEEWIQFFLRGVIEISDEAYQSAQAILHLRESIERQLQEANMMANGIRLLDLLFSTPILSRKQVTTRLGFSMPKTARLLEAFVEMGILSYCNQDQMRNIRYRFSRYLDILESDLGTY